MVKSILLAAASVFITQHLVSAQAGSSPSYASYSCDPSTCIAPACYCASKDPPAGLSPSSVPQMVSVTFDDSIQPQLLETAYKMLNVNNPNGCKAKGTWYVSMQYNDYASTQQWYAAGNEVADHTFSHVGSPSEQELVSCQRALNAYAGIPYGKIQGFRAPFLNYTTSTLKMIKDHGFTYDSSVSSAGGKDFYPYTLDNGLANDCWKGVCDPSLKVPGLFEIPMYSVIDGSGTDRLMDVYLDGQPSDAKAWTLKTFESHYNGNRQPFGIYVHPTHLTTQAGGPDANERLSALVSAIQEMATKKDVWFVTNLQLVEWMKKPVPASEMGQQPYMHCGQPDLKQEICNGLDESGGNTPDNGLINSCNFGTTFFKTCFNCPSQIPTVANPVPPPSTAKGQAGYREMLPDNCDSKWWDPIAATCLCTSSHCEYKDTAVAIDTKDGGANGSAAGSVSKNGVAHGRSQSSDTVKADAKIEVGLMVLMILYGWM
ncbi:unnamed protein product [Umbelopsis ramanniana]